MNKRLFIVHGWMGSPTEPLMVWLGEEGKRLRFETTVVEMPNPTVPTIDAWIKHLDEVVMYPDENTCFVGHSIGFQAILRYIQSADSPKTGSILGIAPWFTLTGIDDPTDKDIVRPWLDNPIDFQKIKRVVPTVTAIFSDNDPFVPLAENSELFKKNLNATCITESGKGHFEEKDGVTSLQSAGIELGKICSEVVG
jgi:predicted alpha/beta hydrolase family esterase